MAATITELGTNGRSTSGNSLAITVGSAAAIGDTVLVTLTQNGTGALSSITDSRGNTYQVAQEVNMLSGGRGAIWYSVLTTALQAADTITVNHGNGLFSAGGAYRVQGLTATPLDKANFGRANSTAPLTTSTGTLTQAAEFIFGMVGQTTDGTFTPGATYSQASLTAQVKSTNTVVVMDPEYKSVNATTAVTVDGTLGTSGQWIALVTTWKIATNAVTFDAASSSAYQAAVSTYNWSHTCTGSNLVLLVGISVFAAGTVTGITYNGVAMTRARARTNGLYRSELWYLIAPATGANSIAVTLSTSLTSIGSAVSYAGCNQTTPVALTADAVGTGNPASVSLTTPTDNDWTVDLISTSDAAITVGGGQTSRANNNGALGSGAMSDKGPVTPPAASSMSWTAIGVTDTWAYIIAALDPAADAPVYNVTLPDADTEICANDLAVTSFIPGSANARRLLVGVGV